MSVEQLQEDGEHPYVGAEHAVESFETTPGLTHLITFGVLAGKNLDQIVDILIRSAEEPAREYPNGGVARILPELKTPAFRRYVAAKMGMM